MNREGNITPFSRSNKINKQTYPDKQLWNFKNEDTENKAKLCTAVFSFSNSTWERKGGYQLRCCISNNHNHMGIKVSCKINSQTFYKMYDLKLGYSLA